MYSTSLWVLFYLGDLDIYCRLAKKATFPNLALVVNMWGQIYPIYSSYLPFMVHSQMTEQLNDFQIVTTNFPHLACMLLGHHLSFCTTLSGCSIAQFKLSCP